MAVVTSVQRVVEEEPAHAGQPSFSDLYHHHRHAVFRWARRYCGANAADAEDLTHDVFMKLLKCLPEVDAERAGAWLYRVTANLAISRIRSRRSLMNRLHDLFFRGRAAAHPVAELEARDAASRALALLGELPARERVVLSMHVLDGMSQVEIAGALSFSQGYVSKLLARAVAALRARGCEVADG
jgi:RNA polymerase sigma-70 factor (ECF subfamily)